MTASSVGDGRKERSIPERDCEAKRHLTRGAMRDIRRRRRIVENINCTRTQVALPFFSMNDLRSSLKPFPAVSESAWLPWISTAWAGK
jgi:hypothetical protein